MSLNTYILAIFLCSIMASCSTDSKSYVAYVNDSSNGLFQENETQDWIYHLQYRTAEFMTLIELGGSSLASNVFKEKVENYKDLDYYLLSIKGKNRITNSHKMKVVDHLSFEFKYQINHVVNIDSMQPILYHFENGLNSFGEYRCLLGFEKQDNSDRKIVIKNFENDINIEFLITNQAIAAIPTLDI